MTNRRRSPTADRRALASALRQLREASGLSLEQAASEALDASGAKLSRLETGKQVAGPRDVRDLCRLYDVPSERMQELVSWAETAREPGWFDSFGVNDDDYLGLESAATHIDQFDLAWIAAILQTHEYAESLQAGLIVPGRRELRSEEQIREWLEIRERRLALLEPSSGAHFRFVLDEAVLLRQVGGPASMREQIAHLQALAQQPNIEIRILSFGAGASPGQLGSFTILELPAGPDVAYVEGQGSSSIIDDPREMRRFHRIFELIHELSSTREQSHAILGAALRHHE